MFIILLKIRIKSIFSGNVNGTKKKVSGGKKILFLLLGIYIVVVFGSLFGTMFYTMVEPFAESGITWLYFSYLAIMIFLFCFIGSVFVTQNQLFSAKDNELLLSMPIPTRYILASRMIAIIGLNYLYEALIAIPAITVFAVQRHLSISSWIFIVIGFLILPILVMVFSSIFGYIMAFINSKTGNKNYISLAITLVLFMAYMYFCFRMQHYIEMLVSQGEAIAGVIQKTLPPFYHLGIAITESNIVSFLIYLAVVIIPFIIVYWLLDKGFIKIVTSSKIVKRREYKTKDIKINSIEMALVKKEIGKFTSNTMYMFNAGIGLFFMIIAGVLLLIKKNSIDQFLESIRLVISIDSTLMCSCLAIVSMIMCSLVVISAPSISLESKTLWMLQSMPVSPKQVLMSKVYAHVLICLPFILFFGIISLIVVDFTIIGAISVFALPVISVILNALFGVLINLKFPKFDWINEATAVKQGMAPFLASLVSMASSMIISLVGFALLFMGGKFIDIYLVVLIGVIELASFITYRLLIKKGVRLFERLIA